LLSEVCVAGPGVERWRQGLVGWGHPDWLAGWRGFDSLTSAHVSETGVLASVVDTVNVRRRLRVVDLDVDAPGRTALDI
jgi:hypothetical protein